MIKHVFSNAQHSFKLFHGISARSRVNWLFLFEKEIPLSENYIDMSGNGEIGLKQAFGEDPGWFTAELEVSFQTKGRYSLDTAFLKHNILSVFLEANYRELKK